MAFASLLDAGASFETVTAMCRSLPLGEWEMTQEVVTRGSLGATRVCIEVPPSATHRSLADILALLRAGSLPDRVVFRAEKVFSSLAEAEAGVHRCSVAEVHFHEVGAIDAVLDIVGVCAALETLAVDRVAAGPVTLGLGATQSSHGLLPIPAPAVLSLLQGAPVRGTNICAELVTPTGAALLHALVEEWGPMPSFVIESCGFGAGQRDLPQRPNVCQAVVGIAGGPVFAFDSQDALHQECETEKTVESGIWQENELLLEISTNVDDTSGEVLAFTIEKLLLEGAKDAWVTPIVMKKGRPAHTVHALISVAAADNLCEKLLSETGSLGVRCVAVRRRALPRRIETVTVHGGTVQVKVAGNRAKAEYADAKALAERTGLPLRCVLADAQAAWACAGRETGNDLDGDTSG